MSKRKAKKPRPLSRNGYQYASVATWTAITGAPDCKDVHGAMLKAAWCADAKDCRRLAAWLLKAADYLESKK